MSLIPFILDLADEISELSRGIENDFIYANEHRRPVAKSLSQLCYQLPKKLNRLHPYSNACRNKIGVKCNLEEKETLLTDDDDVVVSTVGKKCFQVSMNVKQFKPNELSVKTIDNCVIVEGKHDDKEDGHGLISRHFIRKYTLPKGYDPNEVISMFSTDGILTVKAPHPQKSEQINERIIQIQQTGPAHFSLKKDSFCGSNDIIAPEEAVNNNVASAPKDEVAPSHFAIVGEEQNSKGDMTLKSDAGIGSVADDTITGNRSGFHTIAQDVVESKIEIPLVADDKITSATDYNNIGDVNAAAVAVESIAPSKVNNHDENGEKTATEEISN